MIKWLRGNKTDIHFKFFQTGDIWRIFLTPGNILTGESRDIENQQMYIFSFDYKLKKKYLINFQISDNWWKTICGVTKDVILITGFDKPDLPLQKGITAINIFNGNILWNKPELSFAFCNDLFVYGYLHKLTSTALCKVDVTSGEILAQIDSDTELQQIMKEKCLYENKLYEKCFYPEKYTNSLSAKSDISTNVILDNYKDKISIEYILFEDKLIFSYFSSSDYDNNKLKNTLEVFDFSSNKIIFSDVIDHNLRTLITDSYFIKDRFLIYIKNKNSINIINLDI